MKKVDIDKCGNSKGALVVSGNNNKGQDTGGEGGSEMNENEWIGQWCWGENWRGKRKKERYELARKKNE